MSRRLAQLLVLAPVALAAAGCGGAGKIGAPVATNQVDLPKSYKFEPAAVQIKAGTSVTWTNHDNFSHTVQVEDGDVHDLDRGKSVTISFPKPGTYNYLCTLHPRDMKGEVIVK